jgi:hypothetical protein
MATSRHLSIAQTGWNFEDFNFFVVFSAYRVQKSKMSNLSHTKTQNPRAFVKSKTRTVIIPLLIDMQMSLVTFAVGNPLKSRLNLI